MDFLADWYPLLLAPVIGSFIGVIVDRWPRGETISGRSFCRTCNRRLWVIDLIPIFSFLLLGGTCRHCKAAIPKEHLVTEILALLFVVPLLFFADKGEQLIGFFLAMTLLTLALIDRRHFWLPDKLTLPLIVFGLGLALMKGVSAAISSCLGAVLGYGLVAGIRSLYLHRRGIDAIGMGDAKLLAAIGTWLGWTALPLVLLVASLSGLVATLATEVAPKAETRVPFGLYLALAFYLVWAASRIPATSHWLILLAPTL